MEFFKSIQSLIENNYPLGGNYEPKISYEEQLEAIQNLKCTIPIEQFFFVLDLPSRKINHAHGIQKWLGYPDLSFTLFDYIKIIHPSHLPSLTKLAQSAFDTANSKEHKLGLMSHHISVQLPLRHIKGNYLLTKRNLYPFQVDKSGKVLAYLNHFVILKEFDEKDALEPRVAYKGEDSEVIKNQVLDINKKSDLKLLKWSKKEKEILQLLAQKPELTHKEIAKELGISYDTLRKTDNHRIIRKAKEYFMLEGFSSIKDVANFLKNQGLI